MEEATDEGEGVGGVSLETDKIGDVDDESFVVLTAARLLSLAIAVELSPLLDAGLNKSPNLE